MADAAPASAEHALAVEKVQALRTNIARVFIGKPDVLRLVLTGLVGGGHVLLEDVPGVGKTVLAQCLARSMRAEFRRVQFTPDLLPGDIVGVSVYDQASTEFLFRPGPIFTNVLVADEINRATPRTQSALLEAMNEAQVSVDRTSHPLPSPFFVIATQNPYEFEGTYPLPESQLDRFMLRVRLGYPTEETEAEIIRAQRERHPIDDLEAVLSPEEVGSIQTAARSVHIEDDVMGYALGVTRKTREHKQLRLGASPRASIALVRASQAHALVAGRAFVTPDDVKQVAPAVLAHRVLATEAHLDSGSDPRERLIREILDKSEVPV